MSEADHWSMAGANILAPDLLDLIRDIVKQQPIIVEHRLYRGGSAPIRLIFDEYEDFLKHLKSRAKPGDRFLIWGFAEMATGLQTENIPMRLVERHAAASIDVEILY
jgi:hypothetical protein